MRQIKFALAGLLSLLSVTAAVAQPVSLPYHTVWGRMGAAPGDTGPGQAIPFTSLQPLLGGMLAANNLSDLLNKATSRTNLGVAIGTNVEAWDADLDCLAALSTTGIFARTGSGTCANRTITGTANQITVSNGDGVAGAPTLSLPSALTFTGFTVTGGTFNSPAFVTPALGTPASGNAANLTGTASGLTSGTVTTNANLTGDVTSVGNATTLTNAPVIAKLLTGFSSTTGTVTASDSILTAIQKVYGNDALKAPVASPTFTGTPAAPTAAGGTNTTQLATTQFVQSAVVAATTGVASIAGNTGAFTVSKGITNSTNDIQLSLTNATLQASPSNPTGTTSATGVMMGLGVTTCRITPVYSGRLKFEIQGAMLTTTATGSVNVKLFFGTGAGPANAAAPTGTQIGATMTGESAVASATVAFHKSGIATGLTPGTTYWFDIDLFTNTGTASIQGLDCMAFEF